MALRHDRDRRLLGFARRMRREATDAEEKMWFLLRGGKLAGFKFRRQHPMAGFILDFYCAARKLAVELDGGQHLDGAQAAYDRERTAILGKAGVRVVRFGDDDVLKYPDVVAEAIYRELVGEESV